MSRRKSNGGKVSRRARAAWERARLGTLTVEEINRMTPAELVENIKSAQRQFANVKRQFRRAGVEYSPAIEVTAKRFSTRYLDSQTFDITKGEFVPTIRRVEPLIKMTTRNIEKYATTENLNALRGALFKFRKFFSPDTATNTVAGYQRVIRQQEFFVFGGEETLDASGLHAIDWTPAAHFANSDERKLFFAALDEFRNSTDPKKNAWALAYRHAANALKDAFYNPDIRRDVTSLQNYIHDRIVEENPDAIWWFKENAYEQDKEKRLNPDNPFTRFLLNNPGGNGLTKDYWEKYDELHKNWNDKHRR